MACTNCTGRCDCQVANGQGIVVTGRGGITDPFVPNIRLGGGAENMLGFDTSGGVVAKIARKDSKTIRLSGSGSDSNPLQANVIIEGSAGNLLQETDQGLRAVFSPSTLGDGLKADGAGNLAADVSGEWGEGSLAGWSACTSLLGQPVYADQNGQLRASPRNAPGVIYETWAAQSWNTPTIIADGTQIDSPEYQFTVDSQCMGAALLLTFAGGGDSFGNYSGSQITHCQITTEFYFDGSLLGTDYTRVDIDSSQGSIGFPAPTRTFATVTTHGTHTFQVRRLFTYLSGAANSIQFFRAGGYTIGGLWVAR